MVHNLGPKWLKWSLLGGSKSRRIFTHDLLTLIDTSEQLMSQRHRIVPPGDSSNSDALQAYSTSFILSFYFSSLLIYIGCLLIIMKNMSHSSPNRPNRDPHYFGFFLNVICWRASQKHTVHEVLDFSKKNCGSMSPKITQKTDNDTVGRDRFEENLDNEFYARKQIFWAMGESGSDFGLEFMRK